LGAPLAGFVSGRGCDLELASNGDIYASIGMVQKEEFIVHHLQQMVQILEMRNMD
jgi:hypothetical protein